MIKFCCVHIPQDAAYLRQLYFSLIMQDKGRVGEYDQFLNLENPHQTLSMIGKKLVRLMTSRSPYNIQNIRKKSYLVHLYLFTFLQTSSPSIGRIKGGTNFRGREERVMILQDSKAHLLQDGGVVCQRACERSQIIKEGAPTERLGR